MPPTGLLGHGGFQARLDLARELPQQLEEDFCAAGQTGALPGDQLPEATVFKLLRLAEHNYQAAVACLAEAGTALGADTLMRALIEAWAHLDYIASDEQGAACRAVALELGMATEVLNSVRAVPAMTSRASSRSIGHGWRSARAMSRPWTSCSLTSAVVMTGTVIKTPVSVRISSSIEIPGSWAGGAPAPRSALAHLDITGW